MASYPTSVKAFTTKTAGATIDASHVNDLQDEVVAIETDLLTAFPGGGADGGQMLFPATQNPSTDANTLDDYEEGSWTPTLGGSGGESGQAYTTQVGRYVKIGKLVHCTFSLTMSTLGTITTAAQVEGLPFTSENTTGLRPVLSVGYWAGMNTNTVFLAGFLEPNATVISLYFASAASAFLGTVAQANMTDTFQIIGAITYRATA